MTVPRSFSTFAIVFAVAYVVIYLVAVEANYPLFSYHPALNQFGIGVQKPLDGPVMFWYGWMSTAAIGALAAALIACALPQSLSRRLWSGWAWLVPVVVMAVFCYLLGHFFLK